MSTNKIGRPLKFRSVTALEQQIDLFFEQCEGNGTIPTVTGLAYFLGTDRRTLLSYEAKDEFFNAIKKAKTLVEVHIENALMTSRNQTGAIFNLKNNFGWTDERVITHQTQGKELEAEDREKLSRLLVPNRIVEATVKPETIAETPVVPAQPIQQQAQTNSDTIDRTKPSTTQVV